ncbi:MAG: glycine zipper domain-containing protein [Ginsengibacter sp.]
MKNLILTFIIITVFAACKNNADSSQARDIQLLTDTTSYHNNNIYSDTVATNKNEVAAIEKPAAPKVVTQVVKVIRVYSNEGPKAPVNNSNTASTSVPPVVATPPIVTAPVATEPSVNTSDAGLPGNNNNTTATAPQPEKKKGWNKATKGAVIGGVAGAIGGVVIGKKKGLGAVIGGVVGAAGGYIIGKDLDKKDTNKFIF